MYKKIGRYALVSLLIVIIAVSICMLLAHSSRSGEGENLLWAYIYTVVRNLALFGSIILFVARLIKWKNLQSSFPYVFGAVCNTMTGIIAIYLFCFQHYTREFLHSALWNLLMGVLLLADIYISGTIAKD